MGYGEEEDSTLLEIVYEYNREKIDRGDGYGQVRHDIIHFEVRNLNGTNIQYYQSMPQKEGSWVGK